MNATIEQERKINSTYQQIDVGQDWFDFTEKAKAKMAKLRVGYSAAEAVKYRIDHAHKAGSELTNTTY